MLIGAGAAAGRDVGFHIGPSHCAVFAWRREAARRVQECELPGQQTGYRSGTLKPRLSPAGPQATRFNIFAFQNIYFYLSISKGIIALLHMCMGIYLRWWSF